MHTAAARFQGDMLTIDYHGITVKERMAAKYAIQLFSFPLSQHLIGFRQTTFAYYVFEHFFCDQILVRFKLYQLIFKFRMNRNCHVGRQSPWRGCPNHHIRILDRKQALGIFYRKFHINRRRSQLCIFNFRFCQCRLTIWAPMYRFQPFINITLFGHFAKYTDLFCFKFGIQGHIGMFPISAHT